MIKVAYWCPFISEVATVNSVLNSAISLKKFSNNKYRPIILNVFGEWNSKEKILEENNLKIIDIENNKIIQKIPKKGFFWSRISYIIIFFFSIRKLHKFLNDTKPDYLVVHLISFIPLFLSIFFKYNTKFILRISGYPILNMFRSFLWRRANNKLYAITTPTNQTRDLLAKNKIFSAHKTKYLPDPVIYIEAINYKNKFQKQLFEKNFNEDKTLLSIGRLTNQKNFEFLINGFNEINKIYPYFNLYILGEGEKKKILTRIIKEKKLEQKVFLIGYKDNVFRYLKRCKMFILTSRYEDPGFVILEAGFMNKIVLSSNCPNGPVELIDHGKNGYLYETNSINSFINTFKEIIEDSDEIKFRKIVNLKRKTKEFTLFNHYLKFNEILNDH